jgi:1,4-alpha-glucan branching enzyme
VTIHGSFLLMLHSHLPYYRKAGMWPFGEENFYECMVETYIPLLNLFSELIEQGIVPKVTVGLTPILLEQLQDPHLQAGFLSYLERRTEAAQKDVQKYQAASEAGNDPSFLALAKYYLTWYQQTRKDYLEKYEGNLIPTLKLLQERGYIEITTSAATHGFLPLLSQDESIEAQLKVGIEQYKKTFERVPKGVWLPECAYRSSMDVQDVDTRATHTRAPIESFLFKHGIKYFFTEYHTIEGGVYSETRRVLGIYDWNFQTLGAGTARPDTGLTTFEPYWMKDFPVTVIGRNDKASFQVWSATYGYPGDGTYREFHRKDTESGLHYWRLTAKDCEFSEKQPYQLSEALKKAEEHASHFVGLVETLLKDHYEATGNHGLVATAFDTELFGHWWFEGIHWLKHVLLGLHASETVAVQTTNRFLELHPPKAAISLPESTWGLGGHYWVWNNNHTSWMWPLISEAERKMKELSAHHREESDAVKKRVLNQALRELLLMQASDWPFLITTFQAKDYAIERFQAHKERFWQLVAMVEKTSFEMAELEAIEDVDNPFQSIDFRWFSLSE